MLSSAAVDDAADRPEPLLPGGARRCYAAVMPNVVRDHRDAGPPDRGERPRLDDRPRPARLHRRPAHRPLRTQARSAATAAPRDLARRPRRLHARDRDQRRLHPNDSRWSASRSITMLPLSDGLHPRRFPIVNVALIAANFAVWLLYELAAPRSRPSTTPRSIACAVDGTRARRLEPWGISWFTAMFMHGSWDHVVGATHFESGSRRVADKRRSPPTSRAAGFERRHTVRLVRRRGASPSACPRAPRHRHAPPPCASRAECAAPRLRPPRRPPRSPRARP